jgi:MFS family permease
MCSAAFILDAALAMTLLAVPFFVFRQLQNAEQMSGIVAGTGSLSYALSCIILTRFVSHAKNVLNWAVAGILIFAIAMGLFPFFRNPFVCGGLNMIAFGSMALVWPALHAWVGSDADPDRRSRHIGWFNVAWSFGMSAGPLLAGPLIDLDYRFAFGAIFFLCLLSATLIRFLPHADSHFKKATDEQLEARAGHDRLSEAHLYCAWAATFTMNGLVSVARSVYPKRVEDLVESGALRLFAEAEPLHFLTVNGATKSAWALSVLSFASAVMFLLLGHTRRWRHKFSWLAAIQLITAAGFFYLGRSHSLAFMLAAHFVLGLAGGMAFFASVTYSLTDPAKKHRRTTINEAMVGGGGLIGSLLFGYLVEKHGIAQPFTWLPLVVLLSVILQAQLLRHGAKRAGNAHSG